MAARFVEGFDPPRRFVVSAFGLVMLMALFVEPNWINGLIIGAVGGVCFIAPAAHEILSGLRSRPKPALESVAWSTALIVQGALIGLIA